MSNPISTLPNANTNADANANPNKNEPVLEVDEFLDGDDSAAPLEVDPIEPIEDGVADGEPIPSGEESASHESDRSADSLEAPSREAKGRSGRIVLILGVLLVGSLAINLKQSRDIAALDSANSEFAQALTAAVERIDVETARANGAEAALARVDSAVDVVNERILGLQDALDGLREATVR